MIAELPGGKEIEFPDSMDEAQVDRICALLCEAMQAAEDAKKEAAALRARLDALATSKIAPPPGVQPDNSQLLAAVHALEETINMKLSAVEAAARANRYFLLDATGEVIGARVG